ncbi:hypothetical protein D3C81_1568630 [compost metagenome]
MLGVRQAGRVHEVAVAHAKIGSGLVHHVGESVFAAGDVLGQGDAGVVTRLDDDTVQQVADADLGANLDEHPRTAGTPGVFADGDRVVFADLPATDIQGRDVGGHQLGQARRRQTLVTIVLDQDVAAGGFHEHVGLGCQLRRRRHHLLCRKGGRGDHQRYKQAKAFGKAGYVHPSLEMANGLMPLWAKRLQAQGLASKTAIVHGCSARLHDKPTSPPVSLP